MAQCILGTESYRIWSLLLGLNDFSSVQQGHLLSLCPAPDATPRIWAPENQISGLQGLSPQPWYRGHRFLLLAQVLLPAPECCFPSLAHSPLPDSSLCFRPFEMLWTAFDTVLRPPWRAWIPLLGPTHLGTYLHGSSGAACHVPTQHIGSHSKLGQADLA